MLDPDGLRRHHRRRRGSARTSDRVSDRRDGAPTRTPKTRLMGLVRLLAGQADSTAEYGCPHRTLCMELASTPPDSTRSLPSRCRSPSAGPNNSSALWDNATPTTLRSSYWSPITTALFLPKPSGNPNLWPVKPDVSKSGSGHSVGDSAGGREHLWSRLGGSTNCDRSF